MVRSLVCGFIFVLALAAHADDEPAACEPGLAKDNSVAIQEYLYSGQFAVGETVVMLALDKNPDDDRLRFGLGVIQFMRAVEQLGQAFFEYGAISSSSSHF